MKKLFKWMINTVINFFKWIWRECRNWQTVLLFGIVCLVVGSPVWVCGLLWLIFGWAWAGVVCAALLAFWWLPGMPYFGICASITIIIKRVWQKHCRKRSSQATDAETVDTEAKNEIIDESKTNEK